MERQSCVFAWKSLHEQTKRRLLYQTCNHWGKSHVRMRGKATAVCHDVGTSHGMTYVVSLFRLLHGKNSWLRHMTTSLCGPGAREGYYPSVYYSICYLTLTWRKILSIKYLLKTKFYYVATCHNCFLRTRVFFVLTLGYIKLDLRAQWSPTGTPPLPF